MTAEPDPITCYFCKGLFKAIYGDLTFHSCQRCIFKEKKEKKELEPE
jgi:hypothetical protein